MNLLYALTGCLIFSLLIVINAHLVLNAPHDTCPWMVNIHRYDLIDATISKKNFHCVGVLTASNNVLTSTRCLDTLPKNSHLILDAGNYGTNAYSYAFSQRFLPSGTVLSPNIQLTSIFITPSMLPTQYVNFIKICTELYCSFDDPDNYGFQYGYRPVTPYSSEIVLYLTQYDFSNSSALCQEFIGNDDNKYCTYHDCTSEFGNINIGGEVLTKIFKGQSYLMGFWNYDACDKNIRVFHKIVEEEPLRNRYKF